MWMSQLALTEFGGPYSASLTLSPDLGHMTS